MDAIMARQQAPKQTFGKWVLIGLLVVSVTAFFYFDLTKWLTLEQLTQNRQALKDAVHAGGIRAVGLYILLYILQTAISLPGATLLTLAGGFLFGPWLGTLYTNIGATLGATLAFLSGRYLMRDVAQKKAGPWFDRACRGVDQHPFSILLTFRLTSVLPFFIVNVVFGLTPIRVLPFMLATALGIIPSSLILANAGQQLGSLNSIEEILSPKIFGALLFMGLLPMVPIVYQKVKKSSPAGVARLRSPESVD